VEQAFKPATSAFVPTFSSSLRRGACLLVSALKGAKPAGFVMSDAERESTFRRWLQNVKLFWREP
jgi:hypothetical protein